MADNLFFKGGLTSTPERKKSSGLVGNTAGRILAKPTISSAPEWKKISTICADTNYRVLDKADISAAPQWKKVPADLCGTCPDISALRFDYSMDITVTTSQYLQTNWGACTDPKLFENVYGDYGTYIDDFTELWNNPDAYILISQLKCTDTGEIRTNNLNETINIPAGHYIEICFDWTCGWVDENNVRYAFATCVTFLFAKQSDPFNPFGVYVPIITGSQDIAGTEPAGYIQNTDSIVVTEHV